MATQEQLHAALGEFISRFAAEPRLAQMTQGWDRTIEVRAADLGTSERLRVEGGRLGFAPPGDAQAEIVMEAASDLLVELFSGRLSPTEPYMSGDLKLLASEADVMRIDVVTLMIWGE